MDDEMMGGNMRFSIKKISLIGYGLIVGLIPVLFFWKTGYVYSGSDMQFHMSRIFELTEHVKNFEFGTIASINSDNSVGSLVNMFYPYLSLLPVIVLKLFIGNWVTVYYGSLWFYGALTFLIAYVSFKEISKRQPVAFWGATFYTLAMYRIFSMIGTSAYGEFVSITFFPLVWLGYERLIKNRQWLTLTVAMLLIAYTHILSLALTIGVLAVVTVLRWLMLKTWPTTEFVDIVKAGVVTVLGWLFYLVPFVLLNKENNISNPYAILHYDWAMKFSEYFINFGFVRGLGLATVIGLIAAILMYSKFSSKSRLLMFVGLILMFIASSTFPWNVLADTPINVIQFPYRILPFALVFLTYVGGVGMDKLLADKTLGYKLVISAGTLLIIAGSIGLASMQYKNEVLNTFTSPKTNKSTVNYNPFAAYKVNASNFNAQFNGDFTTYGAYDYWTEKATKHTKFFVDEKVYAYNSVAKLKQVKTEDDVRVYNVKSDINQAVELPYIYYNGVEYDVVVGKKIVKPREGKHGGLVVDLKRGDNSVKVSAESPVFVEVSGAITALTFVFMGVTYYLGKKKANEN